MHSETVQEKVCGKLYEDTLRKARAALVGGKKEEAIRFLLDAEAILERCSDVPDQPQLENKKKESTLAFSTYKAHKAHA